MKASEKFLYERYKKYFPMSKSFKEIAEETLPMRRVAAILEEYHKEKITAKDHADILILLLILILILLMII